MDDDGEQARQLGPEFARLQAQVLALRLLVLRMSAIVAVALIAVGSIMPIWVEETEDATSGGYGPRESTTYRVVTVGFQTFSGDDDAFGVALRIGFLGLLTVVLLLCLVLLNSVAAGEGHAKYGRVRGLIGTLAIVGSVVATLLSLIAWGDDVSSGSGGWGPSVLLVGVIIGVVIIHYRPWHDLWIDRASARREAQGSAHPE